MAADFGLHAAFLWVLHLYLARSAGTASAKGGLAPSACAYTVCSVCNLVMVMVERFAPVGEGTGAKSAFLRSSCR